MEKKEQKQTMTERLKDIRWMYLLLVVSMVIPAAMPLALPLPVTQPSRAFYEAIEKLPDGSKVVVHAAISVGVFAEEGPLFRAIIEHVSRRNIKWVLIVVSAESQSLADRVMSRMTLHGDKYGEDWAHLGIVLSTEPAVSAWAKDISANTPVDVYGTPVGQLPIMKDIKTLADFNMAILLQGSLIEFWMRQWNVPYKMPLNVACGISSSIAGWRVYFDAGQFVGFLPGIRGAGEYEVLIKSPGPASVSNDAMSLSQILTVIAILAANIAYFGKKGRGG